MFKSKQGQHGNAGWAVVIVAVIAIAAFLYFNRARGDESNWLIVSGTVQEFKIVPESVIDWGYAGRTISWTAKYRVVYVVGEHQYAVWSDAGIRGESEAEVRLALPKTYPACGVRYRPTNPSVSVADCRSM